jgi:hypothetical protein
MKILVGTVFLLCGLQLYGQQTGSGAEAEAKAATYTTFGIKGSTFIAPLGINPAGAITRYYQDINGITHGFLRAPDGTISTVNLGGGNTLTSAINPAGEITGQYHDASDTFRGFLRIPARQDDDTEGDNTEGGSD